jgi:hypothetical protein
MNRDRVVTVETGAVVQDRDGGGPLFTLRRFAAALSKPASGGEVYLALLWDDALGANSGRSRGEASSYARNPPTATCADATWNVRLTLTPAGSPTSPSRPERTFRDSLANGPDRPDGDLRGRPHERVVAGRKRSSARRRGSRQVAGVHELMVSVRRIWAMRCLATY